MGGDQRMWQKVAEEVQITAELPGSTSSTSESQSKQNAREKAAESASAFKEDDVRMPKMEFAPSELFRVQVPDPYPGIQYRKTKDINDRELKYAENRSLIKGSIEEDGEWLRTDGHGFLPMTMNGVQILERVSPDTVAFQSQSSIGRPWCMCCPAERPESRWPPDEVPINVRNGSKNHSTNSTSTPTLFAPQLRRVE